MAHDNIRKTLATGAAPLLQPSESQQSSSQVDPSIFLQLSSCWLLSSHRDLVAQDFAYILVWKPLTLKSSVILAQRSKLPPQSCSSSLPLQSSMLVSLEHIWHLIAKPRKKKCPLIVAKEQLLQKLITYFGFMSSLLNLCICEGVGKIQQRRKREEN